jgi:hypothetical protein
MAAGASDGLSMNMVAATIPLSVLIMANYGTRQFWLLTPLVFFVVGITLLAGRTGFVIYFAILLTYQVLGITHMINFSMARPAAIVNLLLLCIMILVLFVYYGSYIVDASLDTSSGFSDPIVRALEPIRNYVKHGEATVSSMDKIGQHMDVWPKTVAGLLFGTGQYGREGSVYLHADMGYLRMIYGMGLFGTILLMLPFIYIINSIRRRSKAAPDSLDKYYSVIVWLVIFGLIGNLKIVYLPTIVFTNILFTVYFTILYQYEILGKRRNMYASSFG